MSIAITTEYQVQVFRYPHDSGELWKAFVVSLPYLSAEAASRQEALAQIEKKLADVVASSELVTVSLERLGAIPVTELDRSELEAKLRENGYLHYGIFADDPGALEVFDEIERQRNLHTIGGE